MQMETLFPQPLADAGARNGEAETVGVPREKELQQKAKRSLIKPGASPHTLLYQVCVGVIARRGAGRYSHGYHGRLIVWRQ